MTLSRSVTNDVMILTGENDFIRFKTAPALGGRILSIYNKMIHKEFLWNNENLHIEVHPSGTDYDSVFWGGIDELLPNDIPEQINGVSYPDHGELWTTPLSFECLDDKISMYGRLPLSGLTYKRRMYVAASSPLIYLEYIIRNDSELRRDILWKLHAALAIEEGDRLVSSARKLKCVYPEKSRIEQEAEFNWPYIPGRDVSVVPACNGTLDFFYLYDLQEAKMDLVSGRDKHVFSYTYDEKIFPYQWIFASYGGFSDHYMVILEPATNIPVSVNEASGLGQSCILEPGQEINTVVTIYAGENLK